MKQQRRQVAGVVLHIFIECGHPVAGGMKNACNGSSMLAEIARQMNDAKPWMILLQLPENFGRIVDGSVIDENRFHQLDRQQTRMKVVPHFLQSSDQLRQISPATVYGRHCRKEKFLHK